MTVTTQRIKDGVINALRFIEGGDSVRRACDKAGISVTSLYHNTSTSERNAAFLKNSETVISPDKVTIRGRRRRKVQQRQDMLPNNERIENDVDSDYKQLMKELREKNEYITKLEHKLVQTLVLNDRLQ